MMTLFTNFHQVTDPTAHIAALEAYAETRGIDWGSIERERNAANPRVWAPEAGRALGIKGRSAVAIELRFGYPMVELCLTATALVACVLAKAPAADFRGIERCVNQRVMEMAV